ncbi:MAG: hypothetical protein JXB50_01105 [Spirochaetes bacterium]|nr:hypothetical protein [Spirochaetota bacterium]
MNIDEKIKQIKLKFDNFILRLSKNKQVNRIKKVKPFINILILIFISIALCSISYTKLKSVIFSHDDNYKTFYAFKYSFDFYKDVMQKPWKPRLLSCAMAALFMADDQVKNYTLISEDDLRIEIKDYEKFYVRVGIWTVFWLFLTFLIFIILRKNFSLFYMFGIFAALSIYFVSDEYARVYPWDMPMVFFYSLVILLTVKNQYKWLVLILPIATGFKETAIILPFIFLVWKDASYKKRILYMAVTFLLCIAVKSYFSIITKNSNIFFTMDIEPNIHKSFLLIFTSNFNKILFINAGTLFTFFILPTKDLYISCLKVISLIFLICMFIFGHYHEYRIFLELAPFALYGFDRVLFNFKDNDLKLASF